ncbi:MAG: CBS domain-containing protein [Thermoanaerobaculia bacterium]
MFRSIKEVLKSVPLAELELRRHRPVPPSTPLGEVLRLLDEEHRGAVVVADEDKILGIYTERDVLYGSALDQDRSQAIEKRMAPGPTTLSPDQSLADAIGVMVRGGFRQCPLADDNGRMVGLVSSRDILRFITDSFPDAVVNLPPHLHQQMKQPEGG